MRPCGQNPGVFRWSRLNMLDSAGLHWLPAFMFLSTMIVLFNHLVSPWREVLALKSLCISVMRDKKIFDVLASKAFSETFAGLLLENNADTSFPGFVGRWWGRIRCFNAPQNTSAHNCQDIVTPLWKALSECFSRTARPIMGSGAGAFSWIC